MLNDEKCNKISLSSGRQFFIKLSTICANIECLPADPSEDNKRERERERLKIYEEIISDDLLMSKDEKVK